MAVRRKKTTGAGGEGTNPPVEPTPATKKRATKAAPVAAAKKPSAKRTPKPKNAAIEELEAVGGDIVPNVPLEVQAVTKEPDEVLSEAGPILRDDTAPREKKTTNSGKRNEGERSVKRSAGFQPAVTPPSSRPSKNAGAKVELLPNTQQKTDVQADVAPVSSQPLNDERRQDTGATIEPVSRPNTQKNAGFRPAVTPVSNRPLNGERQQDAGATIEPASRPNTQKNAGFQPAATPVSRPLNDDRPQNAGAAIRPESLLSDWDFHLFNEGTHNKLWQKLGNHLVPGGVMFGVWAPNAERVSVVGDFNGWDRDANPLELRGGSGIWEGFVPGLERGATYKYHIVSRLNGYRVDKADPMAVHQETPPATASKVWDLDYRWNDAAWMQSRKDRNSYEAPMSIYEVHLGSWRRVRDNDDSPWRPMTYREIAEPLSQYVKKMNFTHIELMPLQEHPFYGSWGYQGTGYFAPTSRYGTPQDLKYLIDVLHQNGIGVLIDWVPSHFPTDEHGLSYFDGTHLYEHSDPRKGFHPDWGSLIFNYGRNEVRSFLLSSALYWLDEYHIDGLRVDAVASMLYLDYSRKHGEWLPNEHGGRENLEAISFLRRMNEDVYKNHPDVQVIAEESTAWPMVSRPTYVGGLGFGMKWDMGWMHDTLRYFAKDPVHRKFHHNDLTFRMMYAFTENFVLPLSHDEVVHGKGSLLGKMPGDEWRRAANLRLLFAHMYANPGKKLLFMGGEFGQYREWNHDASLDWNLLEFPIHAGINRWVEDLNKAYRDIPAFHELDTVPEGFEWIDCCDTEGSVVSLLRRSKSNAGEVLVVVMNFTPIPRHNYQVGVPHGGRWTEVLNSDAPLYGGSGQGNMGGVDAAPLPLHGRRWSVNLTLPPLGAVFLVSRPEAEDVAPLEEEGPELQES